jgi:hypothetical protein
MGVLSLYLALTKRTSCRGGACRRRFPGMGATMEGGYVERERALHIMNINSPERVLLMIVYFEACERQ